MRKITNIGIEELGKEESDRIYDMVFEEHSDAFHFLAFDRQLTGMSPLGTYLRNYPIILENESKIISDLVERQEVESLYPKAKVSLYPVTKIDESHYSLDMANYVKHFADILELNDTIYKTKYLFVDFGHGADNFDEKLVVDQLCELLTKSKILEAIFIDGPNW